MKKIIEIIANSGQYVLTAVQTNEVLQIVELVLSILTTLFILGVNIYSWWKKASADGKIDKEEVEELQQIVNDGKEKLENKKK